MRTLRCIAGMMLLAGTVGCQCTPLTDRYADVIDHVADSGPTLDCLYHPCLDLTRIGQPDWCRCSFNRLWCRGACRGFVCDSCRPICCPFCAEDHPLYEPPPVNPPGKVEGKSPSQKDSETVPPKPGSPESKPPKAKPSESRPPLPDSKVERPPIPEAPPKKTSERLRLVGAKRSPPARKVRHRSIFGWK